MRDRITSETASFFRQSEYATGKPPVLVSACFLGFPSRWHGRPAKRRSELLEKLKEKYTLVPVCPEQLGGMSTPRTSETLCGHTGAEVLDGHYRIVALETGEDVTEYHVNGSHYVLDIARTVGAVKAYLKGGSPTCDKDGVTGELLRRNGIDVIRVG